MFDKLRNGYLAEEKFIIECLSRNIPISRPVFNVEPYDFIVEINGELKRVQVKKAWVDTKGRHIACLKGSYPGSNIVSIVSQNERVDIIAILDNEDWYFIPRYEIKHISSQVCVSEKGKYDKYRNVIG